MDLSPTGTNTRELLLDAATKLFAVHGCDGTKVADEDPSAAVKGRRWVHFDTEAVEVPVHDGPRLRPTRCRSPTPMGAIRTGGHEGFEVPHYDMHLYFLPPEEMAEVR